MSVVIYGLVIGISLGVVGAGGSIFSVPFLVYGLTIPLDQAIPLSLMLVSAIALSGSFMNAYNRNINYSVAIIFSLIGAVFVPLVLHLSMNVNHSLRMLLFSLLMFFVAGRMLLSPDQGKQNLYSYPSDSAIKTESMTVKGFTEYSAKEYGIMGAGGIIAGILSGFFGVGGGFIIVPILKIFLGMSYHMAIGTALMCVFLISAPAGLGYIFSASPIYSFVTFGFVMKFLLGGIIGVLLGTLMLKQLSERFIRIIFALFVIITALFILLQQSLVYLGRI